MCDKVQSIAPYTPGGDFECGRRPSGVRVLALYTPCTTAEVLSAIQRVVTFSTVDFCIAFPAQKCKDLRSSYGHLGAGKNTRVVLIIGQ